MKIIVEREPFAEAISAAMHAAGRSNNIPILNHLLLKPNGQAVGIAGTNLDHRFESSVPADITGGGAEPHVAVRGDALVGIVNRLPKGAQLTLEWNESSKGVSLLAGRSRYKLLALPANDYPDMPPPANAVQFAMSAKVLVEAFKTTAFATDQTRNYLKGVYWHQATDANGAWGGNKRKRMAFVATDGHSLARYAVEAPSNSADMPPIIVPDAAIGEIVRLFSVAEGSIDISISSDRASFAHGEALFTTKLLDETFPDYERAVPGGYDKEAVCDAGDLLAALQRLELIHVQARVGRFRFEAGKITISASSAEKGEAEEIIEASYEGPQLDIGILTVGVAEILQVMDADVCKLRFCDPATPVLFNAIVNNEPDYSRTFLRMPMRM